MTPPEYEKHTTSTDALDTLGFKIGPDEKRDAIHLAVEPAIAGHRLQAGTHVDFDPATGIAGIAAIGEGVGIVDPFLVEPLEKGDQFWLVVYPRQIASLRHVWEHPSFAPSRDLAPQDSPTEKPDHVLRREAAAAKEADKTDKDAAEQWLRNYLQEEFYISETSEDGYYSTFDEIIEEASSNPDYLVIRGSDASGPVPEEFWQNLAIYLGRPVPHGEVYFSCSC